MNVKSHAFALIVNAIPTIVESGVTGTTYSFMAVEEDQEFVQCAVRPVNGKGEGDPALSDMIVAGAPYAAPWRESFDPTIMSVIGIDYTTGDSEWGIADDTYFEIPSQDGDGWAMSYLGDKGDASLLYSGKINLGDLDKPGMTLYVYNISAEDLNTIELFAGEVGGELSSLKTVAMNATGGEGWNMVSADLSQFKGKTVQVGVRLELVNYEYSIIDNLRVRNMLDCDLVAESIYSPLKAKVGKEFSIDLTVLNDGLKDVPGFTATLYADGKEHLKQQGEALKAGERTMISFRPSLHALADDAVEYYCVIEAAGDADSKNNASATVSVQPVKSTLPAVTDLSGSIADGKASLAWSEPDMEADLTDMTKYDFEDEVSFAHSIEDWIFVDSDKQPVGGFKNFDIPTITPGVTLASFVVFDSSQLPAEASFGAHSGTKYLAAIWRNDEKKTNDWVILPELNGEEQTVTFYARSYNEMFYETFTVYTSTTSSDLAEMVKMAEVEKVPVEWTEYTYTVPAGTKYFAINSHSSNNYILMLDDFTFIPAPEHKEFSLMGYNVYRDEQKLDMVEENEYVDSEAPAADHKYAVTAVYDKGESKSSNVVVLSASGIDGVDSGESVAIIGAEGSVTVLGHGMMKVSVVAPDGKTVGYDEAEGKVVIPTGKGIFIVTVNGRSAKIQVRD